MGYIIIIESNDGVVLRTSALNWTEVGAFVQRVTLSNGFRFVIEPQGVMPKHPWST